MSNMRDTNRLTYSLGDITMSDKQPNMKKCLNVECGGKLQPHSFDNSVDRMDCDGPCSVRRVEAYRASMRPTKKYVPEPAPVDNRTDEQRADDDQYLWEA